MWRDIIGGGSGTLEKTESKTVPEMRIKMKKIAGVTRMPVLKGTYSDG
jgi:hypothetical protein